MIGDKLSEFIERTGYASAEIELLPGAGSDRTFHRIRLRDRTAILMSGKGHGAEIDDWAAIQRFLHGLGFGVPELFVYDETIPAVLVEDLGDFAPPDIEDYTAIVRELARLAVIAGDNIDKCPAVANRPFDTDAFRWESTYFSERYLRDFRGIDGKKISALAAEFDSLAGKLSHLPKFFCHRDFQSTNVSIIDGRVRIIDFQSAKHGPAGYDLASLLWDPYIEMPPDARNSLIEQYLNEFESLSTPIDRGKFSSNLELLAISRLMQALGAFCFLSDVKGKPKFREHIPLAERRLRTLLEKHAIFELII